MNPLAIDLFCGLGGWTEGLLAEGYDVVGFDIERHEYGDMAYPAQLVVQDVLTLHGRQFKDAALIVASPPCQEYSYMAMPWSKAKAKAKAIREDTTGAELERLTALFNGCFRIQREASEAAGHRIPLIVENVRGAIAWVGRSRWNFGSFHLWGDVPALMPITFKGSKVPGFRFDGSGKSFQSESVKVAGLNWAAYGEPGYKPKGFNVTAAQRYRAEVEARAPEMPEGIKQSGISGARNNGKGDRWFQDGAARHGSKSDSRKAASAMIAKIPLPLSRHIGKVFHP